MDSQNKGKSGSGRLVTLRLNQQQLELVDRTLARTSVASREDLVRQALRDYAARHGEGE